MPDTLTEVLDRFATRVEQSVARLPFWLYKEHDLRRDFIESLVDGLGPDSARVDKFVVETEPSWSRTSVSKVDLRFALNDLHHWVEFKHWNVVLKSAEHVPGKMRHRVANGAVGNARQKALDIFADIEKLEKIVAEQGGSGLFVSLLQTERWRWQRLTGPHSVLTYSGADEPDVWKRRDDLFSGEVAWSDRPSGARGWTVRTRDVKTSDGATFRLMIHRHARTPDSKPASAPNGDT